MSSPNIGIDFAHCIARIEVSPKVFVVVLPIR
jgi:hypothetical protein